MHIFQQRLRELDQRLCRCGRRHGRHDMSQRLGHGQQVIHGKRRMHAAEKVHELVKVRHKVLAAVLTQKVHGLSGRCGNVPV